MLQMPKAPHALLVELRDVFVDNFKLGELNEFAFELGMDAGNFESPTLNGRARELPEYLARRGELSKLAEVGPERRGDIDWVGILTKHGILEGTTPLPSTVVPGPELNPVVDAIVSHPDFAAPEDRKNMLYAAGVLQYAAGINFYGSDRAVALRVLTQLNNVSTAANGHTPLGDFLRYFNTLPEAFPHKELLEGLIAKYRL
jgi:hypothetical protein